MKRFHQRRPRGVNVQVGVTDRLLGVHDVIGVGWLLRRGNGPGRRQRSIGTNKKVTIRERRNLPIRLKMIAAWASWRYSSPRLFLKKSGLGETLDTAWID